MCLAIPTLIKSVDGTQAEVEIGGVSRTISVALTPEAKAGDYVIVHTGFALSVLDEQEALETLQIFAEMAALEKAALEEAELERAELEQAELQATEPGGSALEAKGKT